MLIKIYCLYEPHTSKIRYIGRTKSTLKKRLSEHLSKARNNYSNSHKENWIRKMLKNGIKPKIRLLKEIDTTWNESHKIEKELISKHLIKHSLVNGDDRGSGYTGAKTIDFKTEEIRILKLKNFFSKEENKNNFYNEIFCYDKYGIYLKSYKSTKFAAEELSVKTYIIGNHLKRESPNSIKGYYFRYYKKDKIEIDTRYASNHKKVFVHIIKSNKKYSFNTIEEFRKYFNLSTWDIHQLRKGVHTNKVKNIKAIISPL